MALHRLLPRNEAGAPRRLRGHGEAVRWAAGVVYRFTAKRFVPAFVVSLLVGAALRYSSREGAFDPASLIPVAVMALGFLATLGTASAILLYLYVFLSGGVMGSAERRRNRPDQ